MIERACLAHARPWVQFPALREKKVPRNGTAKMFSEQACVIFSL